MVDNTLEKYYFSAAKEKYTRPQGPATKERSSLCKKIEECDKNDTPTVYRVSPDSLLNLAIKIVDAFPAPSIFTWKNEDVCRWVRRFGYPQYQNVFRVNMINGRKLLLVDATALVNMNVKNFKDICHLTYGIRALFHFELVKYSRSIDQPSENLNELYLLLCSKSGTKYESMKRSELWKVLQIIQTTNEEYKDHWKELDDYLKMEQKPKVVISYMKRHQLYKCKRETKLESIKRNPLCKCIPPCECLWTKRELSRPWVGSFFPESRASDKISTLTISILRSVFPERYKYSLV